MNKKAAKDAYIVFSRPGPYVPPKPGSISDLSKIFKEVYDGPYFKSPKLNAYFRLLGRYKNKISPRLHALRKRLEVRGAKGRKAMWRRLFWAHNPFLKMLPKSPPSYAPVLLTFGKGDKNGT